MIIKGIDSIFYIKHHGIWCPIACETSNSMNETVEMIGTTTRDNQGWKTSIPVYQSYSFSINGQAKLESSSDILSYFSLRRKKRDKILIEWKREFLDGGITDLGRGYITSISDANEVEGESTFTLEITGFGKPEMEYNNEIFTPLLSQENNEILFTDDREGIATKDI